VRAPAAQAPFDPVAEAEARANAAAEAADLAAAEAEEVKSTLNLSLETLYSKQEIQPRYILFFDLSSFYRPP